MSLCLAGMTVRKDLLGVTSIVRSLGLKSACYDRLLDFFHSSALDLDKLTCAWCALIFRLDPGILRKFDGFVLGLRVATEVGAATNSGLWDDANRPDVIWNPMGPCN